MATELQLIGQGERYLDGHHVMIRYVVYEYHLDFQSRAATRQDDGSMLYYGFDAAGVQTFPSEFEQGERYADGFVKWDGCTHVNFGDEGGYMHLCGGSGIAALIAVLREVFTIAASEMPAFDADTAEPGALLSAFVTSEPVVSAD